MDLVGRSDTLIDVRHLRGMRAQILLWTILPLILVLVAVSFGSITLHQQSMRQMVAERDAQVAALAASNLNGALQERVLVLEAGLARAPSPAVAGSAQETLAADQPVRVAFDAGIRTIDLNGASREDGDPESRQVLATAIAHPGTPAFDLISLPDHSVRLLVAVADLQSGRAAVGMVSGKALGLDALVQQLAGHDRAVGYLLGQDGRILYHQDPSEVGRDLRGHAGVPALLRGGSGSVFVRLPGQAEHVFAYAPVALPGWGLIVEEPWADVVAPVLQYTLLAPLIVLAAAIGSLAALHFGLRRVIRPLQALGRQASRLAWGDFDAIAEPVVGIDEIQELQRTLQEMAAQIRRHQAGMQDYIAELTQTQEDERKRLARELHDETVQSLIAVSQRVKMLELDLAACLGGSQSMSALPETRQHLGELSTMLTEALEEVRRLIRDLRPIYLEDLGLVSALEMLAKTARQHGLLAGFEVAGEERRLAALAEMAVYRIAQAGLSNTVRHGQATEVQIRLEFIHEGVTLAVEDDGVGFVPPDVPGDLAAQGHFGLVGMYERATRLGGHLSIRSAPGQGARVIAFVPG